MLEPPGRSEEGTVVLARQVNPMVPHACRRRIGERPRRRPKNKRSTRFSLFLVQRQTEGKNGAAARFDAGTDFAGMVFDDLPANGKAEAGALRLAVSGEGLEQARHYLRRNTSARILYFRDHLLV